MGSLGRLVGASLGKAVFANHAHKNCSGIAAGVPLRGRRRSSYFGGMGASAPISLILPNLDLLLKQRKARPNNPSELPHDLDRAELATHRALGITVR